MQFKIWEELVFGKRKYWYSLLVNKNCMDYLCRTHNVPVEVLSNTEEIVI